MPLFKIQVRRNNHGPDDDTHKTTRTVIRAGRDRLQRCGLRADQSSDGESRRAKRRASGECFRGAIHINGESLADVRRESEESGEHFGDTVKINHCKAIADFRDEPEGSAEQFGDTIYFDDREAVFNIRSREAVSTEQAGSGADHEAASEGHAFQG